MPLRVQLVLQGGGAKIVALMAAMEAVQELQKKKKIELTRVAGTSAGAIVGCLGAAGVPMSEVRQRLLGREGQNMVDEFKLPSKGRIVAKSVMEGLLPVKPKPVWSTKPLKNMVDSLLAAKGMSKLADIKSKTGTEVYVIATNLCTSEMFIADQKDDITSALLHSSGLPFLFRVWAGEDATLFVDGGICENLPFLNLQNDVGTHGPIAGISFVPEVASTPDSIANFSLALLNTSINNSMKRAKAAVRPGDIHEIHSDILLTDFARAFSKDGGLGNAYDLQLERARGFFDKFLEFHSRNEYQVHGNPWLEVNPIAVQLMERMSEVYDVFSRNRFKYHSSTVILTLYSLIENTSLHYARPDLFSNTFVFEPSSGGPIHCLSTGISQDAEHYLGRTRWSLHDSDGRAVEAISVPLRRPKVRGEVEIIHFFKEPLKSGRFTGTFVDESHNAMPELLTDGREVLGAAPRRTDGSVGKINMIVCIPENDRCRRARLLPLENTPTKGRPMTAVELVAEMRTIPPGFRALGWTGDNVEVRDNDENGYFGFELIL